MTQNALIIGASGGIGAAVAQDLETRGWRVTRLSRACDGLDIGDQANVDAHLEAQNGPYELVFMASGVLAAEGGAPEKALSQIRQESFEEVFKVNTFGVAYVLRHVPKLLPKKGRSVLAVLTARVGSIGDNNIGGWHAYRASKAAANQLLRGAAIELGRSNKEAIAVNQASDDSPPSTSFFVSPRTLMGCTDPLRRGVGAPHQCPLESVACHFMLTCGCTFR